MGKNNTKQQRPRTSKMNSLPVQSQVSSGMTCGQKDNTSSRKQKKPKKSKQRSPKKTKARSRRNWRLEGKRKPQTGLSKAPPNLSQKEQCVRKHKSRPVWNLVKLLHDFSFSHHKQHGRGFHPPRVDFSHGTNRSRFRVGCLPEISFGLPHWCYAQM